ncbi:ATP synthase subunit I [Anaerospora hongkongensis]|uniref:ATP synthase subunit I n=1 Tax=Anaerospora hongkongensis TaxID=244830 RepID=UPI00289FFF12|nr:ATP synthase subunit I [Anaerospora hongkongensis]
MNEYIGLLKRILSHLLIWIVLVAAVLYGTDHQNWILGFIVGAGASIVYFILMSYRILKSLEVMPSKAVSYMRAGWLIRLIFVILVLILALKIPGIHFLAAIVGLFSLQFIIVLEAALFVSRHYTSKGANSVRKE